MDAGALSRPAVDGEVTWTSRSNALPDMRFPFARQFRRITEWRRVGLCLIPILLVGHTGRHCRSRQYCEKRTTPDRDSNGSAVPTSRLSPKGARARFVQSNEDGSPYSR